MTIVFCKQKPLCNFIHDRPGYCFAFGVYFSFPQRAPIQVRTELMGVPGSAATILNDLWKFSPSTGFWTWINGDNEVNIPSVYGSKGITSASNKPGARAGALQELLHPSLFIHYRQSAFTRHQPLPHKAGQSRWRTLRCRRRCNDGKEETRFTVVQNPVQSTLRLRVQLQQAEHALT